MPLLLNVRLAILRTGVDVGLVASMASAPAPDVIPKMSRRALFQVRDCRGDRKSDRRCTVPPAPGTNVTSIDAASVPALNMVSSVRQTDPPTPLDCAAAETSDRYGTTGGRTGLFDPTFTICESVLLSIPRVIVKVTAYEPAAE